MVRGNPDHWSPPLPVGPFLCLGEEHVTVASNVEANGVKIRWISVLESKVALTTF